MATYSRRRPYILELTTSHNHLQVTSTVTFIGKYIKMASLSTNDIAILGIGLALAVLYLFRDSIFSSGTKTAPVPTKANGSGQKGSGDPRDFVAKMVAAVSLFSNYFKSLEIVADTCPFG